MTWNYRLMPIDDAIEAFGLFEVYYDDDGNPEKHTERPIVVVDEKPKNLRDVLDMMAEAMEEPVLIYDEDNHEYEEREQSEYED